MNEKYIKIYNSSKKNTKISQREQIKIVQTILIYD